MSKEIASINERANENELERPIVQQADWLELPEWGTEIGDWCNVSPSIDESYYWCTATSPITAWTR